MPLSVVTSHGVAARLASTLVYAQRFACGLEPRGCCFPQASNGPRRPPLPPAPPAHRTPRGGADSYFAEDIALPLPPAGPRAREPRAAGQANGGSVGRPRCERPRGVSQDGRAPDEFETQLSTASGRRES